MLYIFVAYLLLILPTSLLTHPPSNHHQAMGAVKALTTKMANKDGEEEATTTETAGDADTEEKSPSDSKMASRDGGDDDDDISLDDLGIPQPNGGSAEVDQLIKTHDELKPTSDGPPRKYPQGWDPSLVSPMFFGYTAAKEDNVDSDAIAAKQAERDEQDRWDNNQVSE